MKEFEKKERSLNRKGVLFATISGVFVIAMCLVNFYSSSVKAETTVDEYELSIQELGIKLKVPSTLAGLKYSVENSPWGSIAYLSSSSLEKVDSDSQCKAKGALGVIWIVPKDPKSVVESAVTSSKQLNGQYVAYQRPQALCSSNKSTTKLQIDQIEQIENVINAKDGVE